MEQEGIMADRAGLGSLILSISIIGAVALVTFQATQEQGSALGPVPTWSPSAGAPAPAGGEASPRGPDPAPLGPQNPSAPPAAPATWSVGQITGALLVYLSSLDGQVSDEEIRKITADVAVGWKVQTEESLKPVVEMVRSGKGEQVVRKALEDLGKSSYDVKVQAMAWVADWLRTQGWSWESIQKATGKWTQDILKLDSVDFWGALRKE